MSNITINKSQRLYVIHRGEGFSCLGFDVAHERGQNYAAWLRKHGYSDAIAPVDMPARKGTKKHYAAYLANERACVAAGMTGARCDADLTDQLRGLEGFRVEVVTTDGERRRFIVGRSTGPLPIHLEIHNRRSLGGVPAERTYQTVTPLYNAR